MAGRLMEVKTEVGASRADGRRVSFVAHVRNLGRRWGLALILRCWVGDVLAGRDVVVESLRIGYDRSILFYDGSSEEKERSLEGEAIMQCQIVVLGARALIMEWGWGWGWPTFSLTESPSPESPSFSMRFWEKN